MAKATIGGVDYEVRPFKLRELRQAAPFIDRIGERSKAGASTIGSVTDSLADMLAVVAVGIEGVTAENLEASFSMPDANGLRSTFDDILVEAGMKTTGEAKAADAPPAP